MCFDRFRDIVFKLISFYLWLLAQFFLRKNERFSIQHDFFELFFNQADELSALALTNL